MQPDEAEDLADLVRRRNEGATLRDLAQEQGVEPSTILRRIRKAEQIAHTETIGPIVRAVRNGRDIALDRLDEVWQANCDALDQPGRAHVAVRAVEVAARVEGVIQAPTAVVAAPQPKYGVHVAMPGSDRIMPIDEWHRRGRPDPIPIEYEHYRPAPLPEGKPGFPQPIIVDGRVVPPPTLTAEAFLAQEAPEAEVRIVDAAQDN